jgi:ligand-binding sensor domain-containing protein/signal transduction histidine kinase
MRWRAILIVLVVFPSLLQGETLPIRTYTVADGLASDRINNIVTDSRGFLWFCTPEGLSRFDGYHFVTYGVDAGLPDSAVITLQESKSGDRWIATAKGLSRLAANENGSRFKSFNLGGEGASPIVALVESRSGKMWAATETELFEWTDALDFRRHDLPTSSQNSITALAEDSGRHLWVGREHGIAVLGDHDVTESFTSKDGLPGEWVEKLLSDSRGGMWAALRGGLVRFVKNAQAQWVIERVFTESLVGSDVKTIAEASNGTLWVGTTRGISRLRWENGREVVIENLNRSQGLSDRTIRTLAEDEAGNMWAGTASAGVMRIGHMGFTTYNEQDGLRSDRVWSVLEDRAGDLLAVTIPQDIPVGRSIDIFNGKGFHRVAPAVFADRPFWGWNQILLQSRSGEWWAATRQGVCRFDTTSAVDLDRRKPRACYATDVSVFNIFEDSKGTIWASAQSVQGDRLLRLNPETNHLYEFPYPRIRGEREGRADDMVSAFAEDPQGDIWMGLYKGGLYRFNGLEFQHFQQSDGVPNGPIIALLSGQTGVWIGSEGGGLGWIKNSGDPHPSIEIYNTGRGMSSDIIECLVEDRAGHVYAGTAKGVDRVDPETGHVRHFSPADGLARGEFHGAVRDHAGSLWFATTQGLSRLIPTPDPQPQKPRILITDLLIGGIAYGLSRLGETRIVTPELGPAQNQLQAEFVGIDYEPGEVVRYSYKLEGADSNWSTPRYQQNVSYAALASGKYRFLVKAVTSEGMESEVPAEIDFTVLPPIWKRLWFVTLLATLTIALVVAAHRYRVAQIVALERMRTAIATDLHDDIGASLSQIAILSEIARVGGNGKTGSEPLERIATLARELVDSMGDIVWSIRSEPRGMESLIRHMREFALDLLTSQGIDFELRTPPASDTIQISLQVRRQLFLMFKECIHNAARHSRCTAVVAEVKVINREVLLIVEDNGIGLDFSKKTSSRSGGTGISGMQNRAKSLGGSMNLTSSPGQGCRVEIRVPALRGGFARAVS